MKALQVSETRGESQADQTLNNFHHWLHSLFFWSAPISTPAYWSGQFSPPWSLRLTDWLEQPPPPNTHTRISPLQHLGLSSEVYSPSIVSVEISMAGLLRGPRPQDAQERRRGALVRTRLPSWLFEGRGQTEGKSIRKKQEACDGMANQVSALMFQMLGELVAWLVVLRASVQPYTISSKHIHTRGSCIACRFTHIHSLRQRVSISSNTFSSIGFFHFQQLTKYMLPQT